MPLNSQEIEKINSYGPFNHSVWRGRGVVITNEEVLEGRAQFLASTIRKAILEKFSRTKLKKMSIVDVGCYDGWILHELSELPFRLMVGIEARKKNIVKGKKIRKLLDISTRVHFKQGSIETLSKEPYDIVLCIGTFHHLESIPLALRKLDAICKKMLIIETLCLPSEHITEGVKRDMEMKDIIYKHKSKICGLTGQKFESSYYDGSTAETAVVSVPSIETLLMYLDVLGYDPVVVAARPKNFKRRMKKNTRPSQEVLIYAMKNPTTRRNDRLARYIRDYEQSFITTLLQWNIIEPLYECYCLNKKKTKMTGVVKLIADYIAKPSCGLPGIKKHFTNAYVLEIITAFRFNPSEKIALEYGKLLFNEDRLRESVEIFKSITQNLNADWRATYRSFYMLSKIYSNFGNRVKSRYYMRLCKTCHPSYPLLEKQ